MSAMFSNSIFNNSLNLNTINVIDMRAMFRNNIFFNQDLSHWCVSKIMTEPKFFRTSATNFSQLNQPNWGTCN